MSLYNREYSEKRDYIRMKIDSPVEITLIESQENLPGKCLDLSGGGMLLTMNKEVELGTELIVSVSTQFGHQPMLTARCTVSRIEPMSSDSYLLGLEISEMLDSPEEETVSSL